jgi:hypothetical protein
MAEKVRFSELSETDGVAIEELELLPLLALVEAELLQAAAARHTASDTDATAAPFLATRIIKTTSCLKRKGRRVRIQACSISSQAWWSFAALASLTTTLELRELTWP